MSTARLDRRGLTDGARTIFPMLLPAIPFGLVLGVAMSESMVNQWVAWSSSWLIFAGSSQFVAIELLDDGAGVLVVAISAWVINARHIMYSAALSSQFSEAPRWWKFTTAYVLVDQAFAMVSLRGEEGSLSYRMSFLLGGGLMAWSTWQVWVSLGIIAGDVVPSSWSLEFAIPILFLTLMILAITNSAGAVAAVVGGLTAVLASDFPNGTGLLLGALLGVIAGGVTETVIKQRDPSQDTQ